MRKQSLPSSKTNFKVNETLITCIVDRAEHIVIVRLNTCRNSQSESSAIHIFRVQFDVNFSGFAQNLAASHIFRIYWILQFHLEKDNDF